MGPLWSLAHLHGGRHCVRSWPQEHLDRVALVHRAAGAGGLVEGEFEIEDLAGPAVVVPVTRGATDPAASAPAITTAVPTTFQDNVMYSSANPRPGIESSVAHAPAAIMPASMKASALIAHPIVISVMNGEAGCDMPRRAAR